MRCPAGGKWSLRCENATRGTNQAAVDAISAMVRATRKPSSTCNSARIVKCEARIMLGGGTRTSDAGGAAEAVEETDDMVPGLGPERVDQGECRPHCVSRGECPTGGI